MPTDKTGVSNLTIVDPETGQKTRIDTIPTLTMAIDDTSQYEPIKAFTTSGSIEEIAEEVFLNMPLGREVVDLEFKQNRIHRKKRINKKWARKYGYTCKVYYMERD